MPTADEVPSLKLSPLPICVVVAPPYRLLSRYKRKRISHHVTESEKKTITGEEPEQTHVAVNTDLTMDDIHELEK